MEEMGATRVCQTEPEAKRMRSGRDGVVMGYTVHSVVDSDPRLIIHQAVSDLGSDNRQLEPVTRSAKATLKADTLTDVANAANPMENTLSNAKSKE